MSILEIAQSLESKYDPQNVDLLLHKTKAEYLSKSIIPSDIFAFSGRGATLQTTIGEFIDFSSMTVNCILGQNDPWVNANIIAYLASERPSFLTTRLGSDFYYKVAKRIIEMTTLKEGVINHRQCNGTDVTELAVVAAFKHRKEGKHILASFKHSYHGQGLTAYLMSGLQRHHRFLINESPILFLEAPSNTSNLDKEETLSVQDQQTLATLEDMSSKVFAVIIEPIQVNNAINTPTKSFMRALKEVCQKNDIALIFDEVQTGFGWLGKMTAAEKYGVAPNLLALSKALTSGNGPLSVLVSDKEYQHLSGGTGEKTNGADIRSLVAANAVMDRLSGISSKDIPTGIPDILAKELEKGLLSNFDSIKRLLDMHLQELYYYANGLIKNVKGYGLIRGIEIGNQKGEYDPEMTAKLQYDLLEQGVLVREKNATLIIKPPIVITQKELEKGFEKMKKVISKYK